MRADVGTSGTPGTPPHRQAPTRPELTRRQREVLDLVASGRENKEIARTLGVSEGDVKAIVSRLLRRFALSNRTALAAAAAKMGMGAGPAEVAEPVQRTSGEVVPDLGREEGVLLQLLPVGIVVAGTSGEIVWINEAGRRLLGVNVGESSRSLAVDAELRDPSTGRPLRAEEPPLARALEGRVRGPAPLLARPRGGREDVRLVAAGVPLYDARGALRGGVAAFWKSDLDGDRE